MFGETTTTIWNDERPGFLRRRVALTSATFDLANATQTCKQVLAEYPKTGFVQLTIVPDNATALPPPKPDHMSYESWKRWHDNSMEVQGPFAEMLAIDGDAILRFRDVDGRTTKVVLQGKNPLTAEVPGATVEILHFGFVDSTRPLAYPPLDIFVKSKPLLDADAGRTLLRLLEGRFHGFTVSLLAREDTWFVNDWNFPFFFPFGEDGTPPSEEMYTQTRTLRCRETGTCSLR